MFDFGYFNGIHIPKYVTIYILSTILIIVACIYDLCYRRVPNWLWLIGLPITIYSLFVRNLTWDLVYVPVIMLACYALVRSGAWGMGDAKGITWLAFTIGALPTIFIVLISWLIMPKKIPEQPFFFAAMNAMVAIGGFLPVWLM